ncbi:recombinase family protein [Streptomyces albidoflavus]
MTTQGAACGIYARQSRKKRDKSEVSTVVQIEESQALAARRGMQALPPYQDIGISAYDPSAERPGFDRMLRDARAGKFAFVVVYYLSRFSRQEPLEVLAVVRELWSYGVVIISVTEGEFKPGDFGSLISLLARLEGNHSESKTKSENVSRAKTKARNLGGYMGGPPPYGFKNVKVLRDSIAIQTLEPHPVEGPIIRDLVAHILASRTAKPTKHGSHPGSILGATAWLNAHPLATPKRGKSWNQHSVYRILIDPRIAGFAAEYVYDRAADEERRQTKREYRIVRDDNGREVVGNEPLVAPADWYALQDWLRSRKGAGRASPGTSLLAGSKLLVCECEKFFVRFGPVGHPVNYRCPRTRTDNVGRTHEGGNSIAAKHVDDWVARRVIARVTTPDLDDPATVALLKEAARRYGERNEGPETAAERAELVRARASDSAALEALYDREEAGDYDDPVGRRRFRERKDRLTTNMAGADRRLRELDDQVSPLLPIEEWGGEPGEDPIGEGSWWAAATLDERRDFLRLFVDRIVVSKAPQRGGNFLGVTYDAGERLELHWATAPKESQ